MIQQWIMAAQVIFFTFCIAMQRNIEEFFRKKTAPKQVEIEEKEEKNKLRVTNSQQTVEIKDEEVNVKFYLNQIASRPNGEFIENMHKNWWRDYEKLEKDHAFIQWLFPNSFQSRFNSASSPLSVSQAASFISNMQIAQRYVRSYEMMLGFYGMKLKSKVTGQIVRSRLPDYRERFQKTLISSFHNHMRITRILCSLSMVGFGRYAQQLSLFLKHQIHSEDGGLKTLARYGVYRDWEPYQNCGDSKEPSVYFSKLEGGQGVK